MVCWVDSLIQLQEEIRTDMHMQEHAMIVPTKGQKCLILE